MRRWRGSRCRARATGRGGADWGCGPAGLRAGGVAGARAGHVGAGLRSDGDAAARAVAPRLALTVCPDGSAPVGDAAWGNTALALPGALAGRRLRDVVTGRVHDAPPDGRLRVADVLAAAPVALLIA